MGLVMLTSPCMRRVYLSCAHSCGTWRPSGSRLLLSLVLNHASAVEHAARSGLYCRLLLKPSATANCRARRRSTRSPCLSGGAVDSPLTPARYRGIPQISLCLHVRNLSVEAPFLPLVSEGFFGVSFLKCAASPLHGQQDAAFEIQGRPRPIRTVIVFLLHGPCHIAALLEE